MPIIVACNCAVPSILRRGAAFRYLSFASFSSSRRPTIGLTSSFPCPGLCIPRWRPRFSLSLSSPSSPLNPSCFRSRKEGDPLALGVLEASDEAGHDEVFNKTEDPHLDADNFKEEDEGLHGYSELCSSHIPVLLSKVLAGFQDVELHTFVDCTLGAGGHASSLNVAERGFSLQQDGPLDMRMDPSASLTASYILNNWPEVEIGRILRDYGEERQWKRLARRICEAQLLGGIHSTGSLLKLIQKSLPSRFSPGRAGWKRTAVRVFQALRITVNDELSSLEAALPDLFECLRPEGRLAVISFHSLEDRIVKQFFLKVMGDMVGKKPRTAREFSASIPSSVDQPAGMRTLGGGKVLEGRHATILTRRPLIAGLDEVKLNSRARSAKLRILVKKELL